MPNETRTWALLGETNRPARADEEKMQKQLRQKMKGAHYLGFIESPPTVRPSLLVRDVDDCGKCGWALLALHGGSAPPRGDER